MVLFHFELMPSQLYSYGVKDTFAVGAVVVTLPQHIQARCVL